MNIRPVDLQVLIPRATEVAKNQQQADHQTTLQQQQFAEYMQKVSTERQQQVQHTPKNEQGKVTGKQDRQPQGQQQSEGEMEENSDSQESAANHPSDMDPVRGHKIDIKT